MDYELNRDDDNNEFKAGDRNNNNINNINNDRMHPLPDVNVPNVGGNMGPVPVAISSLSQAQAMKMKNDSASMLIKLSANKELHFNGKCGEDIANRFLNRYEDTCRIVGITGDDKAGMINFVLSGIASDQFGTLSVDITSNWVKLEDEFTKRFIGLNQQTRATAKLKELKQSKVHKKNVDVYIDKFRKYVKQIGENKMSGEILAEWFIDGLVPKVRDGVLLRQKNYPKTLNEAISSAKDYVELHCNNGMISEDGDNINDKDADNSQDDSPDEQEKVSKRNKQTAKKNNNKKTSGSVNNMEFNDVITESQTLNDMLEQNKELLTSFKQEGESIIANINASISNGRPFNNGYNNGGNGGYQFRPNVNESGPPRDPNTMVNNSNSGFSNSNGRYSNYNNNYRNNNYRSNNQFNTGNRQIPRVMFRRGTPFNRFPNRQGNGYNNFKNAIIYRNNRNSFGKPRCDYCGEVGHFKLSCEKGRQFYMQFCQQLKDQRDGNVSNGNLPNRIQPSNINPNNNQHNQNNENGANAGISYNNGGGDYNNNNNHQTNQMSTSNTNHSRRTLPMQVILNVPKNKREAVLNNIESELGKLGSTLRVKAKVANTKSIMLMLDSGAAISAISDEFYNTLLL